MLSYPVEVAHPEIDQLAKQWQFRHSSTIYHISRYTRAGPKYADGALALLDVLCMLGGEKSTDSLSKLHKVVVVVQSRYPLCIVKEH